MKTYEQSCRAILISWCTNKAKEERQLIGRCRNAYKDPVLMNLTNRYADTLESAAMLFENLAKELMQ